MKPKSKTCTKCAATLTSTMFPSGYAQCKLCRAKYCKEWRSLNAQRLKASKAAYYQENRARIVADKRASRHAKPIRVHQQYLARRKTILAGRRRRYDVHPQKYREYNKARYASNPGVRVDAIRRSTEWRLANPTRDLEIHRAAATRRIAELADSYVRALIRARIRVPSHRIPVQMVAAVKSYLQLTRLIKESRK